MFSAERARATLWEYRYLNYFLVPRTQHLLTWLAGLPSRTTVSFFHSAWLPLIPDPNERQAIITALHAHELVAISEELIEVTPKGRDYIQFRGPLPPAE